MYQIEKKNLENIALKSETLYLDSVKGKIAVSKLQDYLDAMAYVSKSKIFILNITPESLYELSTLDFIQDDLESYLYEDLNDILKGNEVFRNSQFSKTFDTRMIFYGRPIIFEGSIEGCIILFTPISIVSYNLRMMVLIIASITLFSSLLVSLLVYISAKRITRSIEAVSTSALKIANGLSVEDLSKSGFIELNELINSFNYMRTELTRIEAEKKSFISMISHEIKTPLTVIGGYLEAIHDDILDDEEIEDSLQIIYKETQRLTQLTKEIVTRTTNQDMDFYLEPTIFKLNPLLHEVTALARVNRAKNINIEIDCDDSITLYADENKLRQIITNLLSNSIKYSPKTVTILIRCNMDSNQLCLSISDNGFGIRKSELENIFNAYYRVKNTPLIEGNGLGLSIVKKLVELHKGTIQISSEYKKGTTVALYFPL
jgi:signal transduction histidine kinase